MKTSTIPTAVRRLKARLANWLNTEPSENDLFGVNIRQAWQTLIRTTAKPKVDPMESGMQKLAAAVKAGDSVELSADEARALHINMALLLRHED